MSSCEETLGESCEEAPSLLAREDLSLQEACRRLLRAVCAMLSVLQRPRVQEVCAILLKETCAATPQHSNSQLPEVCRIILQEVRAVLPPRLLPRLPGTCEAILKEACAAPSVESRLQLLETCAESLRGACAAPFEQPHSNQPPENPAVGRTAVEVVDFRSLISCLSTLLRVLRRDLSERKQETGSSTCFSVISKNHKNQMPGTHAGNQPPRLMKYQVSS